MMAEKECVIHLLSSLRLNQASLTLFFHLFLMLFWGT